MERFLLFSFEFPAHIGGNGMQKKNYEELEMKDDFMFGKVMENQELCREILETLLGISIDAITYPEKQKSIDITSEGRSVRLDVYVQDDQATVYDAEMQQGTRQDGHSRELPQRSRYYQGMIDLNLLEKGVPYQDLQKCYIIFICTFDPFGKGRHRYTFQNICEEDTDIRLSDQSIKIFFNTKGTADDVTDEVRKLLAYLDTKTVSNALTRKLDCEVEKARHNEMWRREYMKTVLHDMEVREEGREETLKVMVQTCRSLGATKEMLQNKLQEEFSYTQERARECIDQFWE